MASLLRSISAATFNEKKPHLIHSPFLCDAGNISFCYIQLVNADYEVREGYLSGVATRIIIIMISSNFRITKFLFLFRPQSVAIFNCDQIWESRCNNQQSCGVCIIIVILNKIKNALVALKRMENGKMFRPSQSYIQHTHRE